MDKLNPDALAETYDEAGAPAGQVRPGVQPIDADMIRAHVIEAEELPAESARPFAEYLNEAWYDYVEEPGLTNGGVISGALAYWRGQ